VDSAGIWKGVLIAALGTVAGGLALTALSWAFGFHHAVWVWIVSMAGSIGDALAFPLPVPVWLVALSVVAFFDLMRFVWRIRRPTAARTTLDDERTPVKASAPSDNEITVVRLLAMADGKSMTLPNLASRAALSNLVTDQAIERLVNRGFVIQILDTTYQQAYLLTSAGRDYAIAEGYVGWYGDGPAFPKF
jgi:predicted transcriptional regulator